MCIYIISLYVSCVIAKIEDLDGGVGGLVISILLASIGLIYPVMRIINKLSTFELKSGKWNWSGRKVFGFTTVITFGLLFFIWLGYMPGGFSIDSVKQWQQAVSGVYNDWHPVIHTFLFFTLPSKIYYHPGSSVIFQMVLFSMAVGYLMATMSRWQCNKKFWILTFVYIICNPLTWAIMMYPWKDGALTIVLIVLTGQTINLYFTKGKWLDRPIHIFAMSLLMAAGMLMRHNAILYVGVFACIMLVLWKEQIRNILKVILLAIGFIFLIKGPFYSALGVQAPGNRPIEILGLPMTILGNVIVKEPEALSQETKDFLYEIASQEEWEEFYVTGNFNSIKGEKEPGDIVAEYGIKNVLNSTVEAVGHSKKYSLEATWELTDLVWDIGNEVDYYKYVIPDFSDTPLVGGFTYSGIEFLRNLENKIIILSSKNIYGIIFWNVGLCILTSFSLAACLIKRKKLKWVLMVCPLLAYDFGTMLLLSGDDLRFFHFNFCIILPLVFIGFNEISNRNIENFGSVK